MSRLLPRGFMSALLRTRRCGAVGELNSSDTMRLSAVAKILLPRAMSTSEFEEAQHKSKIINEAQLKKKQNDKDEEHYKEWSERREKTMKSKKYKVYTLIYSASVLGIASFYLVIRGIYNYKHQAHTEGPQEIDEPEDACEVSPSQNELVVKDDYAVEDLMSSTVHKSQAGFKERKIIEYENRLRHYSTPDKLFRYFATLQEAETGAVYMTPEDFVRALTPDTLQPIGLGLDEFKKFDKKNIGKYVKDLQMENSVFIEAFGQGGLISFSDYIFLLTVLGTSARHISIAFRMFDVNGDGEVDLDEFKKVNSIFMSMSATGSRHRDRKTTGNVVGEMDAESSLTTYFFGTEGKGKLTVDGFVNFKRRLQREVMKLEFSTYKPVDGTISEQAFAEILLTYAALTPTSKKKILKRISAEYAKGTDKRRGITFDDYLSFFEFLLNLRDVEMALSFHTVAGQPINPATFAQVGRTVAGVELREHLINVIFCIFDENGDGMLSNREFISIMKDKVQRGLNKPKDTGLTRFLSAIYECGKQLTTDKVSAVSHVGHDH